MNLFFGIETSFEDSATKGITNFQRLIQIFGYQLQVDPNISQFVTSIEDAARKYHREEAICCPTRPTAGQGLNGSLFHC